MLNEREERIYKKEERERESIQKGVKVWLIPWVVDTDCKKGN